MGIPNDTGGIYVPTVRGGFFDTHEAVDHSALGPAYITDLPRPLQPYPSLKLRQTPPR